MKKPRNKLESVAGRVGSVGVLWLALILSGLLGIWWVGFWWLGILWIIFSMANHTYFFFRDSHEDTGEAFYLLLQFLAVGAAAIGFFALIFARNGIVSSADPVHRTPLDATYFSIVTWTTLGYGDFRPAATARIFAATEALVGYLYMAIMVGKLMSLAPAMRRSAPQNATGQGPPPDPQGRTMPSNKASEDIAAGASNPQR